MKLKLQNKLFAKYPKIFRRKGLPMERTCMCWGIDCPDSWFKILDEACCLIQHRCDHKKLIQVEAEQVKEKFGTLRFYADFCDEYCDGVIALAESMTKCICSECGSTKDIKCTRGWVSFVCKRCLSARRSK